jgi:hypothetical protein
MPIGSGAQYAAANLNMICGTSTQGGCGAPSYYFSEDEFVYMDPNAPLVTMFDNNAWPASCGGGSNVGQVRIPNGARIPGGGGGHFPNNTGGALTADTNIVREYFAACRNSDSAIYMNAGSCQHSLTGSGGIGQFCSHGGSGLSAVGGSLRQWELQPGVPIRHALKMTLPAASLSGNIAGQPAICDNGYRWPAVAADGGWDGSGTSRYSGQVAPMCMGSLLALAPSTPCNTGSELTRRVCVALRDYGAYIVDIHPTSSTWRPLTLNVEYGPLDVSGSEMLPLLMTLQVVTNNSSSAVGGGGTPRVPLAPPIGN